MLALRGEGMKQRSEAPIEAHASEGPGSTERAVWRDHECGIHSRDGPERPEHAEEVSGSCVTFSLYAGGRQSNLVRWLIAWHQDDFVDELMPSAYMYDAGQSQTSRASCMCQSAAAVAIIASAKAVEAPPVAPRAAAGIVGACE